MLMPQSVFLDFLAEEAVKLPTFRLIMGASVHQLIEDGGEVSGVVYRTADQLHEARASLTVGAAGRFSRVRKLAGFTPIPTSSPVELLWFRLPRMSGDPPGTGLIAPRFGAGHVLLTIDRADHWQVGLFFASGRYHELRAAGVEAMRRTIVAIEPRFADNVNALTEWQQFSLLSVASSRCARWYKPGLLLIGDAAHTMSPAAGAGIKYAIEDAVVAARVLGPGLLVDRARTEDLEEVQRQREWPTRVIQALGAFGLWQLGRLLRSNRRPSVPRFARAVFAVRPLAKLIAHVIAFGVWRVRVDEGFQEGQSA
jgi:2-polyprenyl-6-methoxyphenol hydroxylase-like FAD-dependent oxidoreductase